MHDLDRGTLGAEPDQRTACHWFMRGFFWGSLIWPLGIVLRSLLAWAL